MLFLQFEAVRVGIVKAVTIEHDFGAERLRALDLEDRRRRGHADDGLDAELLRGVGDALRVVAGRRRDDAFRLFFVRELADLVVGAAQLECARVLQVLRLQVDVVAGNLREVVAVDEPRLARDAFKLLCGAVDVGNRRLLDDVFDGGCCFLFFCHGEKPPVRCSVLNKFTRGGQWCQIKKFFVSFVERKGFLTRYRESYNIVQRSLR